MPLSGYGWLTDVMGRGQRREHDDEEVARRQARESLAIYETLAFAMERRREVFEVVEASLDPDEAITGVHVLLGVPELHARAVLDLQLRRLTARERARYAEERDRLRTVVAQ
jgi:DNA gyrase subunit A